MTEAPSILYVEDHPQSQYVMKIIISDLMKIPYLTIFNNSENFIEEVENLTPQPNIILLDIHVKPLTGFQMLSVLREHSQYKALPIIALTASVMNEEVEELQKAGFNGVIAKPVDIDRFPKTLNRILAGESIWYVL